MPADSSDSVSLEFGLPVAQRAAGSAVSTAQRPIAETRAGVVASSTRMLVVLLVLAAAVRLPLIGDIPRFTDETDDMLLTYALARGQALPLVNFSSYIGALEIYIVAPFYKLFGPRLEVARAVVAAVCVATILPTFWLGRRLGGQSAGLAAAALMATSAPHILANSRIAWSHSLTPLFSVAAVWLLLRAVEERDARSLAGSGLAAGLALHTHPTIAVMLPGGLLYVLWKARDLLRTRWALLAVAAAALVNVNLLIYNLQSSGDSATFARWVWGEYAGRDKTTYQSGLGELFETSARLVGGSLTDRFLDSPPLLSPGVVLSVSLVVAGLGYCAARGNQLPLLVVASSAVLFPGFLTRYEPVMQNGRYLMPLVPVCLAAVGAGLAAVARPRWGLPGQVWSAVAGALLIFVVGWHLSAVLGFLQSSIEQGLTNQRYYRAESILLGSAPSEEVLVDAELVGRGTGGGGDLLKQFRYMLETHQIPYRIVDRPTRPSGVAGQTRVVVIRSASLTDFGPNIQMTALLPAVDRPRGANFGIYRVEYPPSG